MAYSSSDDLIFGLAPNPLTCGFDVKVGGGEVLPEIDFTLPVMSISAKTWPEVQRQYREMTKGALTRAVRLKCTTLAIEIEHLYEMTTEPKWGADITEQVKTIMEEFHDRHGVRSALRVTVADVRQRNKLPKMRSGEALEKMKESFELCAASGADILSIESTGGKEIFDQAIVRGDVEGIVYSLGVLACQDVRFLWRHISDIALRHRILAGGDSACAFANTAMQLAHQNYIPRVLAALVRAMSAVRTLCAFEEGAVGPGKDCAYENPVIKAVAGIPIAMEGKSAACAHSSPLGNIAAAVCDLWTNESIQNVRLLGGQTPEICTEMLIYDCRLMNTARLRNDSKTLRNLLVESDRYKDPQAIFLDPEICFSLGKAIVSESNDYRRTVSAAKHACRTMREALGKQLVLSSAELGFLEQIEKTVSSLPEEADALWAGIEGRMGDLFLPGEYGLGSDVT